MRIGDQNPDLAARLGAIYHPSASANAVEGRLFAVHFPEEAGSNPQFEIRLPHTQRMATLDRVPESLSQWRPNTWLIARAQTVLETRQTTLRVRGKLTIARLLGTRAHERSDLLRQLVGQSQGGLEQMHASFAAAKSPRQEEFRGILGQLIRNPSQNRNQQHDYSTLRGPLEALADEAGLAKEKQRSTAIVDSNVFIEAAKNPQGASAEFLQYAAKDFDLRTTDGVVREVGEGLIPANFSVVSATEPDPKLRRIALDVGRARRKPISEVDVGAIATAIDGFPRASLATHDADFWAVRDRLRFEGEGRLFILRPS